MEAAMNAEPRRKLAVLACMDARLNPYELLDLERGDAHIVRNAGGLVTEDAVRSLSVSQRLLGTEEVVVVMHRDCGLEAVEEPGGFADVAEELRRGLERLRSDGSLPRRDRIRGLIYDPADGSLEEIDSA
jgi:carbonic anhydrase